MAEAGSFADKVKTQADIVRVVGDYVRLKKAGQNMVGLCPFHSEKTPSFAVHPVKQIYHCFGCGVGGDVFSFVMAVERCDFPESVRIVAEKCGIALPKPKARSPEERQATQQRTALVEMHREAAAFFVKQLNESPEGRAARAYLEDRGLDEATIARFGLGYAPSSGDALLRVMRAKYAEKLMETSGLFSRDQGGRLYDRFRRRIMFPIADERGRVIAFGGRAVGDDLPKYLNSPETPIYTKSNVLYNLQNAKDAIRAAKFGVLVEGYMDAIAVARAGVANVVASCGTSLTEQQAKLLAKPLDAPRIVVNYDPDSAGQAATERSLNLLLEQQFDIRVLALPAIEGKPADPDLYITKKGAEAYQKLLAQAPAYFDYLIGRARQQDLTTAEGKLRAVNHLMPYLQRMPNRLLRSEWASRIASQLRIEEPVLRESMRRAAAERRSEVKPNPELMTAPVRPFEKRLVQMLFEADGFRQRLAQEMQEGELHRGLETEKIFDALLPGCVAGDRPDPNALATALNDRDKRLLFSFAFETAAPPAWEEAESCLAVLRRRRIEDELATVQRQLEAKPAAAETRKLLSRKQELRKQLSTLQP